MKKTLLFGEPMALLIAEESGPLKNCEHFTRSLSGAEVNVAIGLTRLGHSVEYLTRLGDDPFGHYIAEELIRQNIGTEMISYDDVFRTGIQLKERVEDGRDPYAPYYRRGSAAAHISVNEIDAIDLSDVELIHVTGIPPALSHLARSATFRLMERAKERHIPLTFDPNLRPALWENHETMVNVLNEQAAYADVVFPGIGECKILTGTMEKEQAAAFYHMRGVRLVVIKDGKNGVFVSERLKTGEFRQIMVPGFLVDHVVDTVGAGDGFAVGFLSGLLEKCSIEECATRANAIGALQVQHRGDNEGLPDRAQLKAAISEMKQRA